MKISELTPLASLQTAAQIPVAVAGENRSITLGQIIEALQSAVVPFVSVFVSDNTTVFPEGGTDEVGEIVWETETQRFYNAVQIRATSQLCLYSNFSGMGNFYRDGSVRTDCLFIDATGRLFRWNGRALISAGLTDEQAVLLQRLTPIPIGSESELEAMKAAGEIIPGQMYYIPETD